MINMRNTLSKNRIMTSEEITIHNLQLLANAWKNVNFEPIMREYGGINHFNYTDLTMGKTNDCGTSCCYLGFAPNVNGLEIVSIDFTDDFFSYYKYFRRTFPALNDCTHYNFLFDTIWPDLKIECLARTKILIDNNLEIPKSAFNQYGFIDYNRKYA